MLSLELNFGNNPPRSFNELKKANPEFDCFQLKEVIGCEQAITEKEFNVLTCINELLQFIKNFPNFKIKEIQLETDELLKKQPKTNEDLKKLVSNARIIASVRKREEFAHMLTDKSMQKRLLAVADKALTGQDSDEQKTSQIKQLNGLFDLFQGFATFAHLTADELASVAMVIDALISSIEYSLYQKQIKNPQIKLAINVLLDELYKATEEVKLCMNHHVKIYQENNAKHAAEQEKLLGSAIGGELAASMVEIERPEAVQFEGEKLLSSIIVVDGQTALANNNGILLEAKGIVDGVLGGQQPIALDKNFADASILLPLPASPIDPESSSANETIFGYFQKYNPKQKPEPASQGSFSQASTLLSASVEQLSETINSCAASCWGVVSPTIAKLSEVSQADVSHAVHGVCDYLGIKKETLDQAADVAVEVTEQAKELSGRLKEYFVDKIYYDGNKTDYFISKYEEAIAGVKERLEKRKEGAGKAEAEGAMPNQSSLENSFVEVPKGPEGQEELNGEHTNLAESWIKIEDSSSPQHIKAEHKTPAEIIKEFIKNEQLEELENYLDVFKQDNLYVLATDLALDIYSQQNAPQKLESYLKIFSKTNHDSSSEKDHDFLVKKKIILYFIETNNITALKNYFEMFNPSTVLNDHISETGLTFLHHCVLKKNKEACELLITHGANRELIAGNTGTAFDLAVAYEFKEVQYLLAPGDSAEGFFVKEDGSDFETVRSKTSEYIATVNQKLSAFLEHVENGQKNPCRKSKGFIDFVKNAFTNRNVTRTEESVNKINQLINQFKNIINDKNKFPTEILQALHDFKNAFDEIVGKQINSIKEEHNFFKSSYQTLLEDLLLEAPWHESSHKVSSGPCPIRFSF